MKRKLLQSFVLVLISFVFHSCSSASGLLLVENGRSDYRIVMPSTPTRYEQKAAMEFQDYLERISGAKLPVVTDSEELSDKEIIIGNNRHLELIGCRVKFDKLGTDGFEIRTIDSCLVIAGGTEKGSLYGVYTFLEEYLGCRYYTPEELFIPRLSTIHVSDIREMQVPVFDFREMYFPFTSDSSYLLWHKLDRHTKQNWGMWVHTFDDLVPPTEYFDLHPGLYSLVGGNRINDGQLCLSNPEVLKIVISNLREKMKETPNALYWSVSQNDNYLACECDACQAMDNAYGGPAGTMLHFVNQVARQFPEKIISTLAYQYTRHAPKKIKPEKNVNIMLCTIECNRSLPIGDDHSSKDFVRDLKDWSKISDDILLWDYVVQFRNYVSPFPNFHVLQPNLQLFKKYGSKMMFQQGSGKSWSDLMELKSYLIAKLLWNPEADPEAITNDFLYGYYGDAAPYLREYFDMLHENLKYSGNSLWIYGYPIDQVTSFLTPALLKEYSRLFDLAEEAVTGQPEILREVKKARLPLQFAILDISLFNYNDELSYFTMENGELSVREDMSDMLDQFVENCEEAGIERLQEHGTSPEEYRDKAAQFVQESLEPNLARGKQVILETTCSPKYNQAGERALTDGLRGLIDYHYNWLGFEGNDMVALVDLGDVMSISHLSVDFMQFDRAWIFLPQMVRFYGSTDGVDFEVLSLVNNPVPDSRPGMFTLPFSTDILPTPVRYVKVEAVSLKTCPEWHIGAGEKCWIFTDEIIVR